MNQEVQALFSEAVKLKESGQMLASQEMLLQAAKKDTNSAAILAVLGGIYLETEQLEEAVNIFRQAIQLSPTIEAISLGLFHSLWKLGRREEALEEIKRFQSVGDSKDYREIIKEINEKFE